MKKEITVQAKGLNKKFLFLIIMFVAIGLVAALVLLLPASVKAQKEEGQPVEVGGDKYLYELDYEQTSVAYDKEIKIDAKREKTYRELIERHLASKEIDKAKEILKQAKEELGSDACSEMESKISAAEALAEETARLKKIFDYRIEGNQTVTITGLHNKESVEAVIPKAIEGYPVGKIGVMAFNGCQALKRIELPEGLAEIESGAFQGCAQLERLVIPKSVTKIAEGFAPLCDSLKEIKVEEGNRFYTSKGGVLFTKDIKTLVVVPGGYTGWKYTIPDGITKIGNNAFDGCKIEVVEIPESVSVIGEHAFWNCYNLKEITIPKNVSDIGLAIISSHTKVNIDTANKYFLVDEGVLFTKDRTRLLIYRSEETKYKVPDSVKVIDSLAFSRSYVRELELPDHLLSIGNCTFWGCEQLTSIVLPGGIDTLYFQMFDSCYSLGRVEILDGVTRIEHSAFRNCSNLQVAVIPASVVSIDNSAFEGCDSVVIYAPAGSYAEKWANGKGIPVETQKTPPTEVSVALPTSTPEPIPVEVLTWNDTLEYRVEDSQTITIVGLLNKESEEVIIPKEIDGYAVRKIGGFAFSDCHVLKYVEIPEGIVEIEGSAFQGCVQLECLEIPSSVTNIADSFASLCDSLKEIVVDDENVAYTSKDGILFDKDMKSILCVPGGYESKVYTIPEGVIQIGNNALNGCKMEEVVIPESVRGIGEHAFWNCHNLREIVISKNVSEIGKSIVSANTKVNVDAENEFFVIEDNVLLSKDRKRLLIYRGEATRYKLPDELEKVDSFAFWSSTIESIELSEGLQVIGNCAFWGCENLISVIVPGGVDTIDFQTFDSCYSLERVEILDGVRKLEQSAFKNCTNLQEVIIPDSVTHIDDAAFENCDAVVIYTPAGSYAEHWAKNKGIDVVAQ